MRNGEHTASWLESDGGRQIIIGDGNVIREYVAVHQPTGETTTIGHHCFLMAYSHVPHDAVLGDRVTLTNSVHPGGHVMIGDGAMLGLSATVHQHRWIGAGSMIGMGAVVIHDIPPFAVASGVPARVTGVNAIGMQRQGYDDTVIQAVSSQLSGETDAAAWALLPDDIQQAFSAYHERNPTRS
jgi:UDP-N-acetylglucosamine acyltransferase